MAQTTSSSVSVLQLGAAVTVTIAFLRYRARFTSTLKKLTSTPEPGFAPKPNADWKPGMGATPSPSFVGPVPPEQMVQIVPSELPPGQSLYAFLISAVVPRPIAFVSSQSLDGVANLAPYSFFGLMCHNPPTLVFCTVHRAGGKPKDTLANVLATKECVVNMISEPFVEAANLCCGEYLPEVDEFKLSGLTKVPSSLPHQTPRVAEAMVQMECIVVETKELIGREGKATATMVTCEITKVNIHPAVHRQTPNGSDYVDLNAYQPISRLGANDYGRTGGVFSMPRPPADIPSLRPAV